MNHLKTFSQLNEAKEAKKETKTVDYSVKFAAKLKEVSDLIAQAKKDGICGVQFGTTSEDMYDFRSISIVKNKLCVKYDEVYGAKGKTDCVDLKKDANDSDPFGETKALFQWVKKCIAKGRTHAKCADKKEAKDNK